MECSSSTTMGSSDAGGFGDGRVRGREAPHPGRCAPGRSHGAGWHRPPSEVVEAGAGEFFAGVGTPFVPTWTSVDAVSLRRTEALMSPLKPTLSHSAIWASYSRAEFRQAVLPPDVGGLDADGPVGGHRRDRARRSSARPRGAGSTPSGFMPRSAGRVPSPVPTQANPGITIAASRHARAANSIPADRRTSMKSSRPDRPIPTMMGVTMGPRVAASKARSTARCPPLSRAVSPPVSPAPSASSGGFACPECAAIPPRSRICR